MYRKPTKERSVGRRIIRTLEVICYLVGVASFAVAAGLGVGEPVDVSAQGSGAIWTTAGNCANPQDKNHYAHGDNIVLHGQNFTPDSSVPWSITGKPGGASCDPGIVVASGSETTDGSGAFCEIVYVVAADDCGEYQVKAEGAKGDNYRVVGEPPTNTPPPPTDTPEGPTSTPTNTPVPPTATPTDTPVPPTATPTDTPVPPTETPTNTPVPPTATPTNTPVPPTETPTDTPTEGPSPTPTDTPDPRTPSPTPTDTPVPPTATPTNTPQPPTATPTPTEEPATATPTNTPETQDSPTPTNTQPPGDPDPSPTPTTDPGEILIPVTGVELPGFNAVSQRGYFSLGVLFFGIGFVLNGVDRRRE